MHRATHLRTAAFALVGVAIALSACIPQARAARPRADVTITVWTAYNAAQAAAFNDLISQFQRKYPTIKVAATSSANYGALTQKLQSAVFAHNTPTIAQSYENVVAGFHNSGVVQDLTPYIKGKNGLSKKDIADYFPGMWADGLLGKARVMMPFSKSDQVFYFNGALLRHHGIKSPPTTWAQFAADCKKVTSGGSNPTNWCLTLEEYTSNWYAWEYEWGVTPIKHNRAAFNSKAGAAPIKFWQNLVKKHQVVVSTTANFQGQADFDAGKAAFYTGSSAGLTFVLKGAKSGVSVGERPYPAGPKRRAEEMYGAPLFMFKDASAAEKNAGWLFLKFITQPAQTAYWAIHTGYMPVRKSALKLSAMRAYYRENPQQRAPVQQLNTVVFEPPLAGWTKARDHVTSIVESALQGGKSANQAVKDLAAQVNSDLAQS